MKKTCMALLIVLMGWMPLAASAQTSSSSPAQSATLAVYSVIRASSGKLSPLAELAALEAFSGQCYSAEVARQLFVRLLMAEPISYKVLSQSVGTSSAVVTLEVSSAKEKMNLQLGLLNKSSNWLISSYKVK